MCAKEGTRKEKDKGKLETQAGEAISHESVKHKGNGEPTACHWGRLREGIGYGVDQHRTSRNKSDG
jgi:hypothetical protein